MKGPSIWLLAMKQVWREKNNADFQLLAFALWLAILAVTTLTCLTQVLQSTFTQQTANLIGADLVLTAPHPLKQDYQDIAQKIGLSNTSMIEFLSMVGVGDKLQLASVCAIEKGFPLRGEFTILNNQQQIISTTSAPNRGEIWLEQSLAQKLNVTFNDQVAIGNAKFLIVGLIQQHPVALSENNNLAPLLYANKKDILAMGVLQVGSRSIFSLLLAGTPTQLAQFSKNFAQDNADINWITPQKGRMGINRILAFAQRYLAIILFLQVILSSIAIAMCAHHYTQRQQREVALWRCLGASTKTILSLQVWVVFILGTVTSLFSIILGYAIAWSVLHFNQQWGMTVDFLNGQGALLGSVMALSILFGFVVPPLFQLRHITARQIIQRNAIFKPTIAVSALFAVLILGIILTFFLNEPELILRVGVEIVALSFIALGCAFLFWCLIKRLSKKGSLAWRFGLAHIARQKWQSMTQWSVFALVAMALLMVQIVQHDFIEQWQARLSPTTPNYFLINIEPEQIMPLTHWFVQRGFGSPQFYPIVRARMSQPAGLNRPINLTWMTQLPTDNQVVAGKDWQKFSAQEAVMSVEREFAERQHLRLGDTITFEVADKIIKGTIVQLRTVEWASFKPNFFVIFKPGIIDNLPHFYMTSIHIASLNKAWLTELNQQFPEVSIIDIAALLEKVKEMMTKLALSLEFLITILFLLGIMIMYASILATLPARMQESALLQVHGANRILIVKILMIEFAVLGLVAGFIGSLMAEILAKDLAMRFFSFMLLFKLKWLMLGTCCTILAMIICGLLGARTVFQVSPLAILRRGS